LQLPTSIYAFKFFPGSLTQFQVVACPYVALR